MPKVAKFKEPTEIGTLFTIQTPDSPISSILHAVESREKLQCILVNALVKMNLEQYAQDIAIGEYSSNGEIKLMAQKASVLTKLKNQLPSLLHFFRESGFPLRSIHIKVSPKLKHLTDFSLAENSPITPIHLNENCKLAWKTLCEELDADSPVGKSVQHLLKTMK